MKKIIMKKLTSLQILMLMTLALGSSSMYGKQAQNQTFLQSVQYTNALNEAAQLKLQSVQDEDATIEVLTDLAQSDPMVLERIIKDEADLEATFSSIKRFIDKKNREIEKLSKEKAVDETNIARLAVELADAQALFEKTTALHRSKHKHNHKFEQMIKDALMKAEQGVKSLSNKSVSFFKQAGQSVAKHVKKATKHTKKSKSTKASVMASSNDEQAAMSDDMNNQIMMNDQMANDMNDQAMTNDQMASDMNDQAMMNNQMSNDMMMNDQSQSSDEVIVQSKKQSSQKQSKSKSSSSAPKKKGAKTKKSSSTSSSSSTAS